jgi:outer membrane protein, adhesin transport system
MKTSLKKLTTALFIAGVSISFCALPQYCAAQVLTLKDAAQQAILTNPEVLARWHNYLAAGSEREVGKGGYLPSVTIGASAGRSKYENRLGANNFSPRSANITLNQMLYDGFLTKNEVKRLDHNRLVRLYELKDISETTALEVVHTYGDVLRYRKLVSMAEDNYVRHRAVFEQIERKTKAGVSRRVDLEQISGRLALAEANLLTESANLHDVSARFQRLVGVTPTAELENPAALVGDVPSDVGTALITANKKHPTLLATVENIRSVKSQLETRRAANQPRVDFRLRTERGSNIDNISGSTTNNSAEVVMSWNVYNGGSDTARLRQTADLVSQAEDQRDKACRDVRQTLAIAYNDTRKLKDLLIYLDQHQLSIEKARDAYRQQFDIGQRSLLDLLDTENELFQAKRSYVNAEYDLTYAYARTHAGMGLLHSALGISHQDPGKLPELDEKLDGADLAQKCPIEAPQFYVSDKAALDARALELAPQIKVAPAPEPVAVVAPAAPIATLTDADSRLPEKTAVTSALKKWRIAYAKRAFNTYLAFYAKTYKARPSLKAVRNARQSEVKTIPTEVSDIKVEVQDIRHATSSFSQVFRTSKSEETRRKVLTWELIKGRWLIVGERVESVSFAK